MCMEKRALSLKLHPLNVGYGVTRDFLEFAYHFVMYLFLVILLRLGVFSC